MYTAADTPQGPPVLPAGHRLLWGPPGRAPHFVTRDGLQHSLAAHGPTSGQPEGGPGCSHCCTVGRGATPTWPVNGA